MTTCKVCKGKRVVKRVVKRFRGMTPLKPSRVLIDVPCPECCEPEPEHEETVKASSFEDILPVFSQPRPWGKQ